MPLPDPSSYQAIGYVSLTLFAIIGMLNQGRSFMRGFKESPPPAETYTTLKECGIKHLDFDGRLRRLEGWFESLRREMREDRDALNTADEERSSAIHKRLDSISEKVSAAAATIEQVSQRMNLKEFRK